MKKILALLMALVMVVSLLAACSKAPAESTTPAAPVFTMKTAADAVILKYTYRPCSLP